MIAIQSPRFLRAVLWADAGSGAATSLLQLAGAGMLSELLGLPQGLLIASGLVLLVFVAGAAWLASCDPIPRGGTWLLVAGNFAWVAGCVMLLLEGAATTALGQAYLVMQAVAVAVLAELQWLSLRRAARASWA